MPNLLSSGEYTGRFKRARGRDCGSEGRRRIHKLPLMPSARTSSGATSPMGCPLRPPKAGPAMQSSSYLQVTRSRAPTASACSVLGKRTQSSRTGRPHWRPRQSKRSRATRTMGRRGRSAESAWGPSERTAAGVAGSPRQLLHKPIEVWTMGHPIPAATQEAPRRGNAYRAAHRPPKVFLTQGFLAVQSSSLESGCRSLRLLFVIHFVALNFNAASTVRKVQGEARRKPRQPRLPLWTPVPR